MILKPLNNTPAKYPNDVNLLHLMFELARNDTMLLDFLNNVIFIREHPLLKEDQVRRELMVQDLITVPKAVQ